MNDITYILNTTNNKHITRVLDVGCGNGDITKEYAKTLKIEPSNVCGIDILDYENTNNQFIYKKFNGCNIPYENNSFDLVVCFVMIHHVAADKIGLINDIKRVLKPNGILIIREHDVTTTKDIIYLDLIHEVNDFILYDKNIRTNTEFYRMYLSKEKLHSILSPELELIYYKMYTGNNPQKLYYAVYRRSKN
jgi:ubiquinone/menaquinone biosynthesis C-methylase UbiE